MSDPTTPDAEERKIEDAIRLLTASTGQQLPIRTRCIDAMLAAEPWSSFFSRDEAGKLFDAILQEMKEPSEGIETAMMNTGNAQVLVMHTKEFMDKRAVEAGFEPYADDDEARKCVLLAMHWGWRQGVRYIIDGGS